MSFNPDFSKQVQEVICSRKTNKVYHSPLIINNSTITQTYHKHLHVILDSRLTLNDLLHSVLSKTNKAVGLRKLQNILPKPALMTIYKVFVSYFLTKDARSWTIWTKLIPKYLNLICQIWQTKLLFGKSYFKDKSNILILEATVDYMLSKIRFDKPFF